MTMQHVTFTNIIDFELDPVGFTENYCLTWLHTKHPEKLPAIFRKHPVLAIRGLLDPVHRELPYRQRMWGNYLIMTERAAGTFPVISGVTQVPITFSELSNYGLSETDIVFMLLQQKQCLIQKGVWGNPHPLSRLILALPEWKKHNIQRTLEVRLTPKRELTLTGTTYTQKRLTPQDKWAFAIEDATQCLYAIDHCPRVGLIHEKHRSKQFVDFLSVKEKSSFASSKAGIIYDLVAWLQSNRFKPCFRRKPSLRPYSLTNYVGKSPKKSQDPTMQLLKGQTINVYADQYPGSKELARKLTTKINQSTTAQSLNVSASLASEKQRGLNIQVVRDARGIPDMIDGYQHGDSHSIIQHITVENFGVHQQKQLMVSNHNDVFKQSAVINILQELMIKQDLALNKLRMVSNDMVSHLAPYKFYALKWTTPKHSSKADWSIQIACLQLQPNGKLQLRKTRMPFMETELGDDDLKQIGAQIRNMPNYRQVLGIVQIAQTRFVFEGTSLMTLPPVHAVQAYLTRANPKRLISRSQLLIIAQNLAVKPQYKSDQLKLISVLRALPTEKLEIGQVLAALKPKINWKKKVMTEFNQAVQQKFGFWVKATLRGGAYQEYWNGLRGMGLLSIHGEPHYFVASYKPLRDKYTRAIRLKRIHVLGNIDVNSNELVKQHFPNFQRMMQVTFVRNGQNTVVPFPLKYLHEYLA